MTVQASISVEAERGCGHRKPAKDGVGIYLVGPKTGAPCGRLPFPLAACPVCGGGVHAARGWTWIEPRRLFELPAQACEKHLPPTVAQSSPFSNIAVSAWGDPMHCHLCPMGLGMPEGRHGLIWIGEHHYSNPHEFLAEASRMGVSRKIKAVPKGFKLGETHVYLAHRFAVPTGALDDKGRPVMGPGVFSTFMPTGIDLVIADKDQIPAKAEKLAEQYGARVIQVVKAESAAPEAQTELPLH